MDATAIDKGLAATAYAVGNDDIRPIMNTMHFDINEDGVADGVVAISPLILIKV